MLPKVHFYILRVVLFFYKGVRATLRMKKITLKFMLILSAVKICKNETGGITTLENANLKS